jgi:hypothetical protein
LTAVARFVALPPTRRRLLARAALAVAASRVAVSVLPFRWVRRLAARPRLRAGEPRASADDLAWSVAAAGRRLGSTCLTEALALQALLVREGHDATLRFGVAKTPGGTIEAHAWLECSGRVLIGGPESARFAPLPLIDAPPPPA